MSRVFEALRQLEQQGHEAVLEEIRNPVVPDLVSDLDTGTADAAQLPQAKKLALAPAAESRLVVLTDKYALAAERFRLLGLRVNQLREKQQIRSLLVTSSVVQEGKSMVSANLALTLALHEKLRVLLIEGDLRKPALESILCVGKLPGLKEWSHEAKPISEFLYRLNETGVWFLPAGHDGDEPLEILHGNRLAAMIGDIRQLFDVVVIDSPPTVAVADAKIWEAFADATLLVVREGKTPQRLLKKALKILNPSKLIGAVVNGATISHQQHYGYGYVQVPQEVHTNSSGTEVGGA